MFYYRVDLVGTRLSDFAFVKASSPQAAHTKVYKALLKMEGGVKEYVPELGVEKASLSEVRGVTEDTPGAIKKLDSGKPIFDFEDFE